MLTKSGIDPSDRLPVTLAGRKCVARRYARNIARWWMLEYYEHVKGNDHVRFPGEPVMQRGLMPIAILVGSA